MAKTPVLFLAHGSPMNIVLENEYTKHLVQLGKRLPIPKAILVVSSHWLTKGTWITAGENPTTLYDFYGFPQELYDVKYPSPGATAQISDNAALFQQAGIGLDQQRGIDHAAWCVLKYMYPLANIPVLEMSIDHTKTPAEHYEFAKTLAPLRDQGILIIGSGNIVHNLRIIDWNMEAPAFDWAIQFDGIVKRCLVEHDHQALIEYEKVGKEALLSIPTNEHYLPMLYALALQEQNEKIDFTYEGFQNASMSMRCFSIGDA